MKHENIPFKPRWVLTKHNQDGHLIQRLDIDGNVILYQGSRFLFYLMGKVGTQINDYSLLNAYIGVGESVVAEDRSHTGLQGVTQTWKKVEPQYPQIIGANLNQMIWRVIFTGDEANHAWNEMALGNGAGGGNIFNRRVVTIGEKFTGQTWTLDYILEL